jgi:hypothetical protein
MAYLKEFIIGSSYFVFLPFFYIVKYSTKEKNYSYYQYTLVAPVWFGIWNVISLIIAEYFGLSKRLRFLLISIISYLSILLIVSYFQTYKLSPVEWRKYYLSQLVRYLLIWNIVIFCLDKYIELL